MSEVHVAGYIIDLDDFYDELVRRASVSGGRLEFVGGPGQGLKKVLWDMYGISTSDEPPHKGTRARIRRKVMKELEDLGWIERDHARSSRCLLLRDCG